MSWIRGTKKQPLHQGTQVLVFQRDLRILWNLPWSASHCNTHNSLTKRMVLSVFLKRADGDDLHSPIIFSQNTPMSILSDNLKCQALFLLLSLEIRPVFCMAHTGGLFSAEEEEPSFFFSWGYLCHCRRYSMAKQSSGPPCWGAPPTADP